MLKWIFFWVKPDFIFGQYYPGSHCAPSLLVGLINMFMFKNRFQGFVKNVTKDLKTNEILYKDINQCYLQLWYPNQVFFFLSIICSLL